MIFKTLQLCLGCIFPLFCLGMEEKVFFQSDKLKQLNLKIIEGEYTILDDKMKPVPVIQVTDEQGIPYWYRRVFTEVCLTGECRPVDVGIYWECTGDFLGLEVYREPLTKTDHSDFGVWDYRKLMSILENDWSALREYDFEELVNEPSDDKDVDGISGATRKEVAKEAVENAVYTTYTLWHLIHLGEKEQLAGLSYQQFGKQGYLDKLMSDGRYRKFVLELFVQGKDIHASVSQALILEGLEKKDDKEVNVLAMRALSLARMEDEAFQDKLATIYRQLSVTEKVEMISSIRNIESLSIFFYKVLEDDLNLENPWLCVRQLQLLKYGKTQSQKVRSVVEKLKLSEIPAVRKAALEF